MGETHKGYQAVVYEFETPERMSIEDVAIQLFRLYIGDKEVVPPYRPCSNREVGGWTFLDSVIDVYDVTIQGIRASVLYELAVIGQGSHNIKSKDFLVRPYEADTKRLSEAVQKLAKPKS